MNSEKIIEILSKFYQKLSESKDYLNELDRLIGDGDHGTNMLRGFSKVEKQKTNLLTLTPKEICQSVSTILLSDIGGASGPLWGSLFLQLSLKLPNTKEITIDDFILGIEAGLIMIKQIGGAEPGDKTMVDVLEASLLSLKKDQNFSTAKIIAKEKLQAGKNLIAKKGRASYLGNRSMGHLDPGSYSMYLFFETLGEI